MPTRQKDFTSAFPHVFRESRNAVEELGWSIEEEDEGKGIIRASTGLSIFSWGEDVVIEVIRRRRGVLVRVTSDTKAQLFDWGKSRSNVSRFLDELEDRAS
jgi:hypothetical protein